MAGAGYKLFNTGDVLTAAQVNTYLQEQVVMVFADAAARTTALSGVLAEGMVSYLKSTKVVEIYNGTAWASLDDPNAIQNTIVDAKGDLITATANDTPARLAVGSNGDTLVADSAASTGLRWQGNFAAGKNVILNADFRLNQRAFTSTTTSATYGFDRWRFTASGGTVTYSAQAFTPGTAPVAGYEAINYARLVTASQSASSDRALLNQLVEDVRTLSGQTATVSFWAKAASGTPKINVALNQNFGTGGSSSVNAPIPSAQTISTSWARYSFTIAIPSVSGKTISATDSRLNVQIYVSDGGDQSTGVGAQNNTFDIWGVQLEAGSVATAFQTATGTLAGELAACQRYYELSGGGSTGRNNSTTTCEIAVTFKVSKRTTPSMSSSTTTPKIYDPAVGTKTGTGSAITQPVNPTTTGAIVGVSGFSGLTSGNLIFTHDTDFIVASAEL